MFQFLKYQLHSMYGAILFLLGLQFFAVPIYTYPSYANSVLGVFCKYVWKLPIAVVHCHQKLATKNALLIASSNLLCYYINLLVFQNLLSFSKSVELGLPISVAPKT